MNLAEKISQLRRQRGWSQEELAEQMNVSRQAVSKWESAQSTPDLDKLVQLSQLFGVSTDELLKDGAQPPEACAAAEPPARRVSMAEAEAFLAARRQMAWRIALGAFLCVVSPIALLVLVVQSEYAGTLTENAACGIGLIALLVLVAAAVMLFISSGSFTAPFSYLKNAQFTLDAGVSAALRRRQNEYRPRYTRYNMLGVLLCILSVIPLFVCMALDAGDAMAVYMTAALLAMVAAGVLIFVHTGVIWGALQALLKEGEYDPAAKKSPMDIIGPVYWLVAVAIYLIWSLTTDDWDTSWILWPVAAVLYAAISVACRAIAEKKTDR